MTYVSRHRPDEPSIKGLFAEAHRLRDIVLRRLVGVGCEINEEALPKAEAIVSANIGELVAAPEYETLLDHPGGENRIFALLLQSCAAELHSEFKPVVEKHLRPRDWPDDPLRRVPREPSLRLAAENGDLR